jgi:hypothetical protein
MSHQHFSDVMGRWFECDGKALRRGDSAPSLCLCDICGVPLEQGDHGQCQNLVELVSCEEHRDEGRRRIVAAEMEQAAAFQEAAYAECMKTTEGTPEYYQALEGFILLLFPDCNPPTTVLPEAQRPEAPPDSAG